MFAFKACIVLSRSHSFLLLFVRLFVIRISNTHHEAILFLKKNTERHHCRKLMPPLAQAEVKTAGPVSDPMLLNKVTVSATRTEQQLDEVASSIAVISAEQMDQQMANDIRDMVRYEPGVVVGSDSRFGLSGFNIRGMEENRVKLCHGRGSQSNGLIKACNHSVILSMLKI